MAKYKIYLSAALKKELWRKVIHVSALWIVAVIYFIPKEFALLLFISIFCADILWEYATYRRYAWARRGLGNLFSKALREKEFCSLNFNASGAIYALLAAISCTLLFSKEIAVVAMSVMLISDTAAALVGSIYGKTMIFNNKSREGCLAFFISAIAVNLIYIPILPFGAGNVLACLFATLAEIYEERIGLDDNFAIPLIFGVILSIF